MTLHYISVIALNIEPTIRLSNFNPNWRKEFKMVTKTLKKKVPAKKAKNLSVMPVVDSAKEIWFAGLGVFSVAQKESEKLMVRGTKIFDKLVSEGARVEKKSISLAETTVDEIKNDVEKRLEEARSQANESWDNLGNIFDERVSGTLERLGIPTTKDLGKLSGQVQNMSRKATGNWKELEKVARNVADNLGKLESEFAKRVKAVLENLRVPAMEDLNKLSGSLQKISRDSAENLSKLEATVEKRISGALGKLETTTVGEIRKLNAELKKLSTQVADLEKQLKANAKAAADKPAPKKTLAPKAATTMTVAEKKKAAEAISKMKPALKAETTS